MLMAPPRIRHIRVGKKICHIFDDYFSSHNSKCEVFPDNTLVALLDGERFIPDVCVVCDPNKVDDDAKEIDGAPDLIVEILSPSSVRRDKIEKREIYERAGVKEYWLVDPKAKSIEIYLLRDGKLVLDNTCALEADDLIAEMTPQERAEYVPEFKCSLFDDLIIKLSDVFANVR